MYTCKIKLINPDKIFTCKQNLQFAEKCTFLHDMFVLNCTQAVSLTWACLFIVMFTGQISVSLQCGILITYPSTDIPGELIGI